MAVDYGWKARQALRAALADPGARLTLAEIVEAASPTIGMVEVVQAVMAGKKDGTIVEVVEGGAVRYQLEGARNRDRQAQFAREVDGQDLCGMICDACDALKESILSGLGQEPLKVFSQADPVDQIRVHLDHALTRIACAGGDDDRAIWDLAGQLVVLRVAKARREAGIAG